MTNPGWSKEYYIKNRDRIKANSKRTYEANRDRYKAYRAKVRPIREAMRNSIVLPLKDKPCMDCGIQYKSYQMHFDHRPGEIKLFNIAHRRGCGPNPTRLLTEIAKCDVVCANCHAERTYKRSHS